ncbi:MAG: hypothetical protein GY797_33890 [Deltaproteobacteria bacterium]|nr:hypothetical protein [Deltaproteobacteria bacterium]
MHNIRCDLNDPHLVAGEDKTTLFRFANDEKVTLVSHLRQKEMDLKARIQSPRLKPHLKNNAEIELRDLRKAMKNMTSMSSQELLDLAKIHAHSGGQAINSPFIATFSDLSRGVVTSDDWVQGIIYGNQRRSLFGDPKKPAKFLYELSVPKQLTHKKTGGMIDVLYLPGQGVSIGETEVLVLDIGHFNKNLKIDVSSQRVNPLFRVDDIVEREHIRHKVTRLAKARPEDDIFKIFEDIGHPFTLVTQ